MVINGIDLPNIGLIRPKKLDTGDGYTLLIYPPGDGALAGADGGTMMEIVVTEAELARIRAVAPHLVAERPHERK